MHTLIDASHPSNDASGPHQTAYKSQLNYWHLLKVAEDVCWQRRLPRVLCRSAGVLSHSLHLVVGSVKAAGSSSLFSSSSSYPFMSSTVAAADRQNTWLWWISRCAADQ